MYRGIVVIILLVFPSYVSASVRISEIMYDAPGTDAGREWFEVQNTDNNPLDLTNILFFEADTNHKITHVRGSATVAPQDYGIVVDDVASFLADFPSYTGALFDSSWSSFGNEGEAFELRDTEGVVLDRVQYANASGAAGDGLTLHGSGSTWQARTPSPGSGAASSPAPTTSTSPPPAVAPSQSNVTNSSSGSVFVSPPTAQHAPKVSAGGNRTVFAQVATEFSAELTGVSSEAKPFASYRWNFGNGEEVLKRAVLYRYVRPGSYTVSVSVSTGGVTVSDRIVVTVIPTAVSILDVGVDGIELYNGATKDVDFTDWKLKVGASLFTFPKDTILLAGKTLFFESRITSLATDTDTLVDLLYPTGLVAVSTKQEAPVEPLEIVTQKIEEPMTLTIPSEKVAKQKAVVVDDADNDEDSVEESATATVSSTTQQLAAVREGMGAEGGIFWYPVLALVALIGVASSSIFLMKSSKPNTGDDVSGTNSPAVLKSEMEVRGTDTLSTFTIVAKPIQGQSAGSKTNEADSYTIVE